MPRNLDGMAVAITGASSGIGAALARVLAYSGARVCLGARRLDRLQALTVELGPAHHAIAVDVSDPDQCRRFIADAHQRFGRLDTVVCNAGYGLLRRVEDTTPEDWRQILAVNLLGTAACLRAAVPLLRAQPLRDGWRGQIIVVSSILARRAAPDVAAYCATKAAQLSLAESARVELHADRIAVTSVHPIGTSTEFFTTSEQVSGRRYASTPGPMPQQSPEQVARAIAAAIRRPCAEVWPHRPSRWLAGLATLCPGLGDWAMRRHRRIADPR